jgi:GAF domain-containing protein
MKEMSNTNICERVDDLIGFLYGELSEIEARGFERHLHECAACEAEFTAFGQIRESMVEWRNESLGLTPATVVASDPSLAAAATQSGMPAKSALAALREFFALSPLWMRGATAFAAVVFCVCAVLAVAYLKGRPFTPDVANANSGKVYTPQELNEQVAVAVERIRQEMRDKQRQAADQVVVDSPAPKKSADRSNGSTRPGYVVAGNARRPFTRQERQELAADLRLVTLRDEDDLDLVTESNRPTP